LQNAFSLHAALSTSHGGGCCVGDCHPPRAYRPMPKAAFGLLALAPYALAVDSHQFANDLAHCIQIAAKRAADSFPMWGDSCLASTLKVDTQADVLGQTITPFQDRYGYRAALWCSFWSANMVGAKYDPNTPQPTSPQYDNWYETIVCPWNLNNCGI
jgi:hypothetical protein